MLHTLYQAVKVFDFICLFYFGPLTLLWLGVTFAQSLVSYLGFSGMRVRKGVVQTAIITYEHPVTKRRVVCVGMVHVAKKAYFTYLQRRIDALQKKGYAVLYEGVGKLAPGEKKKLTDREREAAGSVGELRKSMKSSCRKLRAAFQLDAITYRKSWIRTDVDGAQFVRSLSSCGYALTDFEASTPKRLSKKYRAFMDMQLHKTFATFPFAVLMMNFVPWQGRIKKIVDLILHERNQIAVRGIRTYSADRNVVTMWGAGHLCGIGRYLRLGSYREIDREWVTVIETRRYGWWESLRLTLGVYIEWLRS